MRLKDEVDQARDALYTVIDGLVVRSETLQSMTDKCAHLEEMARGMKVKVRRPVGWKRWRAPIFVALCFATFTILYYER